MNLRHSPFASLSPQPRTSAQGQMPIKYACVSDGMAVLAENPTGEQPKLAATLAKLLANVPPREYRRKTVPDTENGINYYYLSNGEGRIVACAASKEYRLRTAFDFLETVEPLIRVNPAASPSLASKEGIAKTLKEKMAVFNDPKNDKVEELKKEIDATTGIMVENVNNALGNLQKAEDLNGKTTTRAQQAKNFEDKSHELKQTLCMRNAKLSLMIAGGVLGAIFIIVLIACKPNFSDCSSSSS